MALQREQDDVAEWHLGPLEFLHPASRNMPLQRHTALFAQAIDGDEPVGSG